MEHYKPNGQIFKTCPRGVGLIVTNKWASRIIRSVSDPMGRWMWATLQGKRQELLTLVCAYRPNPRRVSIGRHNSTITLQRKQPHARRRTTTIPDKMYEGSKQLDARRLGQRQTGHPPHRNANQTLTENTKKYSLRQMTIDCDLISTMEARHSGV